MMDRYGLFFREHRTDKRFRVLIFATLFLLLLVPFFLTLFNHETNVHCVKNEVGVLDLSSCDLLADVTPLNGTWLFADRQLDWKASVSPQVISVPSHWGDPFFPLKGTNEKRHGTYRVQLHVPATVVGKELAIRISSVRVASRVLVDGKPLGGSGTVGTNAQTERPHNKPYVVRFTPASSKLNLEVQVSNYNFYVGGINNRLTIGSAPEIAMLTARYKVFDMLIIGILLGVVLFYLGKMFFSEAYREYLTFSLLVATMIVFYATQSEKLIYDLWPALDYDWFNRLALLSGYLVHTLMLLYLHQFKPSLVSTRVVRLVVVIAAIVIPVVLLLESVTASYLTVFIMLYSVTIDAYAIFVFYRLQRARRYGMQFMMIAATAALLYVIITTIQFTSGYEVYDFLPIYVPILVLSLGLAMSERQTLIQQQLFDSEIDKLRYQINPHFIHNALNTIMWMNKRDPEKTQELLFQFNQFLRNSFAFDELQKVVSFEQELETTEAYLALEQARFGDHLQVHWNLEVTDFSLPPLTLQPLVENAVRHGVTNRTEGGTVWIETVQTGTHIILRILDDGPGFTNPTNVMETKANRGVGLLNVHLRLQKLLKTSLQIENRVEGGASVTIRINKE